MRNLRYAILVCNCLLVAGVAFNSDLASVLISTLQHRGCLRSEMLHQRAQLRELGFTNTSCCMQCLGLSPLQYNTLCGLPQFFGVFAAIFTGVAIDNMGYCKCAFFLAVQALLGTGICTVATIRSCYLFVTSSQAFGLLLVGRILFVMAGCGLVVTRNYICGLWFAKGGLTTALGISIAVNSLGNAVNFLVTAKFAARYSLTTAFILGLAVCCTSVLGAVGLSLLDSLSEQPHKSASKAQRRSSIREAKAGGKLEEDVASVLEQLVASKVRFSGIRAYPLTYWAALGHFVLCTACIWPFISNACKFVNDRYHLGSASSVIVGSLHFTCLFAMPLIGLLSDKARAYGAMGILASVLFVFIFACLLINVPLHPAVWFVLLGIAYAVSQTNSLAIIFNVSAAADRATASALATAFSLMISGLVSIGMGLMLSTTSRAREPARQKPWERVLPGFEALALLGLIVAVAMNIADVTRGRSDVNPCCRAGPEHQRLTDDPPEGYGAVTSESEEKEGKEEEDKGEGTTASQF